MELSVQSLSGSGLVLCDASKISRWRLLFPSLMWIRTYWLHENSMHTASTHSSLTKATTAHLQTVYHAYFVFRCLQGAPKKWDHRLVTIIMWSFNWFLKKCTRFLGEFVVKRILKIPSHLACVATLLCETLMSAKQAINNKLQGSVDTYLTCGGVVNNRIRKGLLPSLSENF